MFRDGIAVPFPEVLTTLSRLARTQVITPE